jgi:hypothetical protein
MPSTAVACRFRRAATSLAIALALAVPAVAAAAAPPPVDTLKGYGPAPFGTRWDKAQKIFPKAEIVPEGKNLGAPNVGGPFVHRLYLTDQHVEGLPKPVNVELSFWKKNLWVVLVYWRENTEQDVLAALTR